jgi:hypothetical protein
MSAEIIKEKIYRSTSNCLTLGFTNGARIEFKNGIFRTNNKLEIDALESDEGGRFGRNRIFWECIGEIPAPNNQPIISSTLSSDTTATVIKEKEGKMKGKKDGTQEG